MNVNDYPRFLKSQHHAYIHLNRLFYLSNSKRSVQSFENFGLVCNTENVAKMVSTLPRKFDIIVHFICSVRGVCVCFYSCVIFFSFSLRFRQSCLIVIYYYFDLMLNVVNLQKLLNVSGKIRSVHRTEHSERKKMRQCSASAKKHPFSHAVTNKRAHSSEKATKKTHTHTPSDEHTSSAEGNTFQHTKKR